MALTDRTEILQEVRNEVGLPFDLNDVETNERLERYIKQGAARLERIAGSSIDFDTDLIARGLLIDYCRYANAQMSEFFEANYAEDLASLNADYNVKARLGRENNGTQEN